MLDDYIEHCNEALKVYGDYACSGLCSRDHFNIWMMAQKAQDAKDSSHFSSIGSKRLSTPSSFQRLII